MSIWGNGLTWWFFPEAGEFCILFQTAYENP